MTSKNKQWNAFKSAVLLVFFSIAGCTGETTLAPVQSVKDSPTAFKVDSTTVIHRTVGGDE